MDGYMLIQWNSNMESLSETIIKIFAEAEGTQSNVAVCYYTDTKGYLSINIYTKSRYQIDIDYDQSETCFLLSDKADYSVDVNLELSVDILDKYSIQPNIAFYKMFLLMLGQIDGDIVLGNSDGTLIYRKAGILFIYYCEDYILKILSVLHPKILM